MKVEISSCSEKELDELEDIQEFLQEDKAIRYEGAYNVRVIHPHVLNLALELLALATIRKPRISCSRCGFELKNNICLTCDGIKMLGPKK